ncbi:MAG: metallophosphoesterase [Terriglobales bacterium]
MRTRRADPTVDEMDQAILERLNASVKVNDILYFLGDFCMGSLARVIAYRRRIRCMKIFALPGNHDKQARKLRDEFSWLDNLAEVSIDGRPIVLCHYALRVWNRSNRGSWHLYGQLSWAPSGYTELALYGCGSRHTRLPFMAL